MSAVKALQQWCKIQCKGYRDVSITNMTTSFRDGLAFCAMIHKYRPELMNICEFARAYGQVDIFLLRRLQKSSVVTQQDDLSPEGDFDSLKKDDVYENNKLAFSVAEQELGIPALLDAEDMVALRVPDRLSILTYVSQYYNYFHGRSPIGGLAGVKRPAELSENGPSGKKNLPVVAKSFPASKPALESRPAAPSSVPTPGSSPSPAAPQQQQQEEESENPSLSPAGTLSNKCVSCHKRVHLVQRHLVDGKLYHRNCAKSTLKANASLRDLLQKGSSSKAHSETPEPSESTSSQFNSDSSWLTTKKQQSSPSSLASSKTPNKLQPASSPSPAPSVLANKTQPSSSPTAAPSWRSHKMQRSTSPNPTPSGLTNKTQRSSSPSPAPSWTTNKTQRSSSPSPAPSWTTNKTQRSSSPSPAPSGLANKTQHSSSPSPAPSWTTNKTQRSSSPSPAPSWTTNKTQRSSSPNPAPSGLANKTQRSSSPNPAPSGLANKTQRSSSPSPAPSWTTNKTVSPAAPSASGPALSTTSSTGANKPSARLFGTTTTYKTSINTTINPTPTISTTLLKTSDTTANYSINTTPVSITINNIPTETSTTTPSGPTAAPRTSLAAQRTQQAKLRFLQKEPDGPGTAGKDNTSAAKDSSWNRGLAVPSQGTGAAAKGLGVSGGHPDGSKTQAAALISRKLAKESKHNDTKSSGVSAVETPKRDPAPPRGRVKLKVDRSLLADLHPPSADPSPDRATGSAAGKPWQAELTPQRGPAAPGANTPPPGGHGQASSQDPTHWRSNLKPVTKETKTPDPQKPSAAGRTPASGVCVGPSSTPLPGQPGPRPAPSGFLSGSGAPSDDTKPPSQPSKKKPDYIPKEKIMKELQEIEDQLNELEGRGVELEKRLRRSEEEGEEDAAMDEVMVAWFNLIREKQVAMRRESELVYIAKTQDLEEEQPSVEQELRTLMEKPENAKTSRDRQREKELMAKLVEIVNDRNAIVDGLDEDRLREDEEDEQLQQLMKNLDIKKEKTKKKSPMSKLFSWGSSNNNNNNNNNSNNKKKNE